MAHGSHCLLLLCGPSAQPTTQKFFSRPPCQCQPHPCSCIQLCYHYYGNSFEVYFCRKYQQKCFSTLICLWYRWCWCPPAALHEPWQRHSAWPTTTLATLLTACASPNLKPTLWRAILLLTHRFDSFVERNEHKSWTVSLSREQESAEEVAPEQSPVPSLTTSLTWSWHIRCIRTKKKKMWWRLMHRWVCCYAAKAQ